MRQDRSDRLAERARLKSLADGRLIDVSVAAQSSGIRVPVALSRGIWTSLVRPFPSAQPGDFVPLEKLLDQLQTIIPEKKLCSKRFRYFLPVERPTWLGSQFLIHTQFNYIRDRLVAVIICSVDELFAYKPHASPAVLPSTLMVRLFRLLQNLSLCGRAGDTVLLSRMRDAADLLVKACPLLVEMHEYFAGWRPTRPTGFSCEEFRHVQLRTMGELLICLGACESAENAKSVNDLVRYHLAMASPLSDLTEITESMLRLAARLPNRIGPILVDPFRHLLEVGYEMRYSLSKGSTTIPAKALKALREQFRMMDALVAGANKQEYLRLREWFEQIDDGSPLGPFVDLGRWNTPEPIWQ